MTVRDARAVAALHLHAFPGFFLTILGERFLREFYAGIAEDPAGIAIIAEVDGQLAGFVAGSIDPSQTYRRLLRTRALCFGMAAALTLVKHPGKIIRFVRSVQTRSTEAFLDGTACLMSLAVHASLQGKSIGGSLVREFIQSCSARSISRVVLTTDHDGNDSVNTFYRRQGFVVARTFRTADARRMNEYQFLLPYACPPKTYIL